MNKGEIKTSCIDLFCGVGGLTHGMTKEGIDVVAGFDLDHACHYPYSQNNSAEFIEKDICEISPDELNSRFKPGTVRILVGCAPCQPFSSYSQRYDTKADGKWKLLLEFERLTKNVLPEIVSMENVPSMVKHEVFDRFTKSIRDKGYHIWHDVVECAGYGVPQSRKRLVLLASLLGPIKLIEPSLSKDRYKTVQKSIGRLKPLKAGERSPWDKLHVSSELSEINLKRIRASKPGRTWRDWPKDLIADCHKANTGKSYPSVYGRMEWEKPSPTITTQCFGFGNGRFGHPEQDRAISLREAAILQGFPRSYKFVAPREQVFMRKVGRLIGNAVPVQLGQAIAKSILKHIGELEITPNILKM